jgi:D-glycero-alpha-D-manno-heptose 1-phosphate guanylyltransferase
MGKHGSLAANHGVITCPVVILCGGLGLRLRPAIQDRPKCLAPIGGRPFLEWLLVSLRKQGCTKVILCLGYGSDQVLAFIDTANFGHMEINHVIEKQPLGTAGGLKNAAPLIQEDDFLAMNGDTILDVDLKKLLLSHREKSALATVALRHNPESTARYGGVEMDAKGRIVRFSEKGLNASVLGRPPHLARFARHPLPQGGEGNVEGCVPPGTLEGAGLKTGATSLRAGPMANSFINGGVYAFAKEIFDRIPGLPASVSLETDVFPSILGQRFYGFPCDGYFLDIGVPEDYQRAQAELPEGLKLW